MVPCKVTGRCCGGEPDRYFQSQYIDIEENSGPVKPNCIPISKGPNKLSVTSVYASMKDAVCITK